MNTASVNVSQTETKYDIDNIGLFYGDNDIFGNSAPILSLNRDDYIILPRTIAFEDAESSISYDTANETQAAVITYSYHGVDIGSVRVNFSAGSNGGAYMFDSPSDESSVSDSDEKNAPVIYVNVIRVLLGMAAAGVVVFLIALIRILLKNYEFSHRNSRRTWRKERRRRAKKSKRANHFRDFDL